uniref:Uncharacterized protein n=1 Tax=Romanomermis culicivorax TaxID=13658 RepID=A0A915I6E8_ROMCU
MRSGILTFILCILFVESSTMSYDEFYEKSRASNYVNPWSWLFDDLLTRSAKAPKSGVGSKSFVVDESLTNPEPEDQETADVSTTKSPPTTTRKITKRPTTTTTKKPKSATTVRTSARNLSEITPKLLKEEDTVYRTKEVKAAVVRRISAPKILFDSEKPEKEQNRHITTSRKPSSTTKKHVTPAKFTTKKFSFTSTSKPVAKIDEELPNFKPIQNTDLLFKHNGLTRVQINYANKPKPKVKKISVKPIDDEDEEDQITTTFEPKITKKLSNKKSRISKQERKVQKLNISSSTSTKTTTTLPSTSLTVENGKNSANGHLLTDHEEEVEQAKVDWQNAKKILGQSLNKESSMSSNSHFSTFTKAASSKISTKSRLVTWPSTEVTSTAAPDDEDRTDLDDDVDGEKFITIHPLPTNRPNTIQLQNFIIPPPIPLSGQKTFLKSKPIAGSQFVFDRLPSKTLEEVQMVPAAKQLPLVVPSLSNTDSEATKLAVRQGILEDGRMDWLVSYNDPRHPNFG